MSLKRSYLFILILLFYGCAIERPITKAPVREKVPPPESPPLQIEDPFQGFAEKYRLKAHEFERSGELPKALFFWKVVSCFAKDDQEARRRMDEIETTIRIESERHFQKGLEAFHKNLTEMAMKEFLMTLAYDPEHRQALDFLKDRLNDQDYILYKTKTGDTLRRISQDVYHDADKEFLISYFNRLDSHDSLKTGITLRLPILPPIWRAKKNRLEEFSPTSLNPSPTPKKMDPMVQEQADIHYAKGVKYFLSEELEKAIEEWEEAIRINPNHPQAKRDLQRARRMLHHLRKAP